MILGHPQNSARFYDHVEMKLAKYNDANQILSETTNGVTKGYEFDANGNMIKSTQGTEVAEWTYNYNNQLIGYHDSLNSGQYWYDASGRRVKKYATITTYQSAGAQNAAGNIGTGNGKGKGAQQGQGTQNAVQNVQQTQIIDERYFLDGADVIVDYNSAGVVLAQYVTPFLDQNLSMSCGGTLHFFMHDGLGSVRNLVSQAQVTENSYGYTAFGEALAAAETVPNRYQYTGREFETESQDYYYRARMYSPKDGRFLSQDPLGFIDSFNLYEYVESNPINIIDSFGLFGKIIDWGDCYNNALYRGVTYDDILAREAMENAALSACESVKNAKHLIEQWENMIIDQDVAKIHNLVSFTKEERVFYLDKFKIMALKCEKGFAINCVCDLQSSWVSALLDIPVLAWDAEATGSDDCDITFNIMPNLIGEGGSSNFKNEKTMNYLFTHELVHLSGILHIIGDVDGAIEKITNLDYLYVHKIFKSKFAGPDVLTPSFKK